MNIPRKLTELERRRRDAKEFFDVKRRRDEEKQRARSEAELDHIAMMVRLAQRQKRIAS